MEGTISGNASAETPCAKPRKAARDTTLLTSRPLREAKYWHGLAAGLTTSANSSPTHCSEAGSVETGGGLGTPPSRITSVQLKRVLRRCDSCRLRTARGTLRDFPNREEVVHLHRLWRRPPGRFGSSTGRWHSPSRQCIQQDRIRGIRYAPEVEVFLFLELVQTGRIGDPSRLSQPTPALSPRQETILRRMIQICNCLRAAPWSS